MKTPLALALALSLALGASPALAWSSGGQRSAFFPTHRDSWQSRGQSRLGHERHFQRHGFFHRPRTVIVVPGHGFVRGRAQPVFVPGHWGWWHPHGWVWVPGGWVW
jgi:hypothetical protein